MKSILIILAAFAVTLSASAQSVTYRAGGTNNVAALTANSYTDLIDTRKQENFAVALSFNLVSAGSSNIVLTLKPAHDGSTVDTTANNNKTITVAANGTNTVNVVTNFASGGIPYYQVALVANTNVAVLTNLTIKSFIKKVAN